MVKKRGPKADHPKHPRTNQEIDFLYQKKRKDGTIINYFFYGIDGKQVSATSNIWKAIKKYSDYFAENRKDDMVEIAEDAQTVPLGRYGSLVLDEYVSKTWIIEAFQRVLENDRKLVVDTTGNPNYWDFENTPPKPPSLTLEEVLQEYIDLPRDKPLNYDYKRRMIRHWHYFRKVIGKSYLRDISFDDIEKYRKTIQAEAEKKEQDKSIKRRQMYVNERFQAIHDTVSRMRKTQEYKADIDKFLQHLTQLTILDEGEIRPKAITQEQWKILYKNSKTDLFIRCGLLLGLNCAMTWGDIFELTIENFDLTKKTYIGTRAKNNIQNCAMLFPETVESVKQYLNENSIEDSYGRIFYYKPVKPKSLINETITRFRDWKRSLIEEDFEKVSMITQKKLRKSLQTTAKKAKCHIEYIKLVMGRKLEGAEEHYEEKDAIMTSEVIDAVHKFYFGDS